MRELRHDIDELLLVIFVCLHLALHRVCGDSRPAPPVKTIAISIAYGL